MFEAIGAIFLVLAGIAYFILSAIVITAFYLFFTPLGWIILIMLFVLGVFSDKKSSNK